ncbi:hypothetical protein BGZ59_003092 [Podila verticillata]|nr:hypothetical protein BGZ59_003092 [Podila verticillata]KFH68737.1 hypothetical protein MVEG_05544 [Podila verticillata NRRL 6337]
MIVPSSYPVQGIMFMMGHPQLITNLICPIIWTILWAIAATIFGFAYLLHKQANALISVNCPAGVAWFVSVLFVLLEIALLVLVFYLIILPIYQDALFDRVLKLRGLRHVLDKREGNDVIKCLRGVHGGLLIVFIQILVLIVTLPLNLIPILGQILYAMINGWLLTFGVRFHYDVEICNKTVSQSRKEAWQRRSEFSGFGSVAVGLEMIPLANLLFMWTNIVGAALWVADEIERDERKQSQRVSQTHTIASGQSGQGPSSLTSPTSSHMPYSPTSSHTVPYLPPTNSSTEHLSEEGMGMAMATALSPPPAKPSKSFFGPK